MLGCVFLAILVTLLVWKFTKFGRLLRPRMRKKEVHLADLIEPADAAHEFHDAHGHDLDLNPVVQARMIFEHDHGHHGGERRRELRPGGAGALGRLLQHLGGSFGAGDGHHRAHRAEATKRERIRQLDRELKHETEIARAAERRRAEDERIFRQAEQAALDAKRGRY